MFSSVQDPHLDAGVEAPLVDRGGSAALQRLASSAKQVRLPNQGFDKGRQLSRFGRSICFYREEKSIIQTPGMVRT